MSDAKTDYFDLKMLQGLLGYKKLQALWAHEYAQVMIGMQKAASKGSESNWRYQAGILKGFDLAIGQLDRAVIQMEKEGEGADPAVDGKTGAEILKELRGELQ
jgi:hypothetical protein